MPFILDVKTLLGGIQEVMVQSRRLELEDSNLGDVHRKSVGNV